MAKRVRDKDIESRAARSKLKARGKPYFKAIGDGLHIGYRKGRTEGKWVVRRYVGDRAYVVETIAVADDIVDADGTRVLDFWQAQDRAREIAGRKRYSGPYRVRDAMDAYLTHLGDDRNRATRLRSRKHILPALGDREVADLTADELEAWHRSLIRSGADEEAVRKSKCTANRTLSVLKSALTRAFDLGKIPSDGAWRRAKLFKGVDRSRTRYLTYAECQRLLNAAEPEFRLLVRGALETGARYGELCRLVVGDFNPDSGTVHIRKSKTGKERHITLTENGAAFFAQLAMGKPLDAPMFGRTWKADEQNRRMTMACLNGHVVPRISFHGLRHTWASQAIMGGVPLPVVAHNLGHVSTKMVEKHYGHLGKGYVRDSIRNNGPQFGEVTGNVKAIR